ncbi:E3 ubiquitin-protein ligase RING1-like [Amaranthus tricolor]|uniref:E3 ubiquitin-protein ligase RING1-like n=1 Tax=Amaranthus tricolor TaxID=29722 RepID=UPI00258E0D83|nr:E3 ubiquitin-protein ligase RING1-like [Amaranthus tricolor]
MAPPLTHYRKLLLISISNSTNNPTVQTCLYHCNLQKSFLNNNKTSASLGFCPMVCLAICPSLCLYTYSNDPLLPSPPNFPSSKPNKPHNPSPLLITMITLFSISFFLIIFYILYTKLYQTRHRISQRSESSDSYSLDEEHGNRVVFHPFWHISTFGLTVTEIQRIPIKFYVKENDMEERDCTVCLGEFKEGESLRVFPKCCHAFHISCIDTWLASHITCPICRSHVLPLDQNDDHDHNHDCEV